MTNAQSETVFTLTISAQEVRVRYRPHHIGGNEPYAILEFTSPNEPRCEIPVSESGYRTFFAPMSEIENAPTRNQCRMVEEIAGQRLSSGPGKSPERWREPNFANFILGLLPKFSRLIRQMKYDFGRVRRRQQSRLSAYEGRPVKNGIQDERLSLRSRRSTLPTLDFGNSSRKMNSRGIL